MLVSSTTLVNQAEDPASNTSKAIEVRFHEVFDISYSLPNGSAFSGQEQC
jgi:hypothetical protein